MVIKESVGFHWFYEKREKKCENNDEFLKHFLLLKFLFLKN